MRKSCQSRAYHDLPVLLLGSCLSTLSLNPRLLNTPMNITTGLLKLHCLVGFLVLHVAMAKRGASQNGRFAWLRAEDASLGGTSSPKWLKTSADAHNPPTPRWP